MSDSSEKSEEHGTRRAVANAIKAVIQGNDSKLDVRAWLEDALNLTEVPVWRKMSGNSGWNVDDLAKVAEKLGVGLPEFFRAVAAKIDGTTRATCRIDDHEQSVDLVVGSRLPAGAALPNLLAVQRNGSWQVIGQGNLLPADVAHAIDFMALHSETKRPRIALLDDDPVITSQAAMVLGKGGQLECVPFQDDETLIQQIETGASYDAFVIDWRLAGRTSERLIRRIRGQEASKRTPMFIVTGTLQSGGEAVEEELARVVREFGGTIKEKPVRWGLVREEITQEIQQANAA